MSLMTLINVLWVMLQPIVLTNFLALNNVSLRQILKKLEKK